MTEEQQRLARVYADVFGTANGRLVFEDMVRTFHDRRNVEMEIEVHEIPHPHRLYYIEGQRSVVRALQEVLDAVERGEV